MWLGDVVRFEMRTWEVRRLGVECQVHGFPFLGFETKKRTGGWNPWSTSGQSAEARVSSVFARAWINSEPGGGHHYVWKLTPRGGVLCWGVLLSHILETDLAMTN